MRLNQLVISFTLVLFSEVLLAANQPQNLSSECTTFIKSIEDRYTYSWIQVAETPKALDTISVFYYYRKTNAFRNPVIFFNGGPGYTSHGLEGVFELNKTKMSAGKNIDVDYIYMDQRGTGCSTGFPIGTSPEAIEKLKWYGSAGMVQDAEEIRKRLIGTRKWKVFGQSFGAHVVHRYIQMYPQSIAKAFAHGYTEGLSDLDFLTGRIGSQARVLEAYFKKNPTDRSRLQLLNMHLADEDICFKKKNVKYCGYEILTPLVYLLSFRDRWNDLHEALVKMVPENKVDEAGLESYVENMSSTTPTYNNVAHTVESHLQKYSIALNFIGLYDVDNSPIDSVKCQLVYDRLQKTYNLMPSQMLLDECKAPTQFRYQDQIANILRTKINASEIRYLTLDELKSNLTKYKIPFYLYSGETDCLIPKEFFQPELKTLGKLVQYTNFPNSGHEGFLSEAKILHDLNSK